MVLSPIINAGIDCISKREFKIILIILLYFLLMSMLQFRVNNGSNLLGLLTIYLLARYMKKYDISLKRINAVKLLLLSSIMMISTIFLCNILKPDKVFVLLSYNNPFIIVMAISMFMFAIQLKPTYISKLNKILSPTLMIYLLTEGIGPFLYEKIATLISNSLCLGILSIILISVSCLLIGYIANLFFYKIYRLIGV